jgi:hypothetical protein
VALPFADAQRTSMESGTPRPSAHRAPRHSITETLGVELQTTRILAPGNNPSEERRITDPSPILTATMSTLFPFGTLDNVILCTDSFTFFNLDLPIKQCQSSNDHQCSETESGTESKPDRGTEWANS